MNPWAIGGAAVVVVGWLAKKIFGGGEEDPQHDAPSRRGVDPIVAAMILSFDEAEIDTWSPAGSPEADRLIRHDLMAFLLAASIDRLGQAEDLWRIPYDLRQRWGSLQAESIAAKSLEEIAATPEVRGARTQISRTDIARTILSVAEIVENNCAGDATNLFEGSFDDILGKLQRIYGVGPGIARMMVILRMTYFGLEPSEGGELLPKLDTHVQRVLKRTGLVTNPTDTQVRQALRGCTPRDVANVDQAAWLIGRDYCKSGAPNCDPCPLTRKCSKCL